MNTSLLTYTDLKNIFSVYFFWGKIRHSFPLRMHLISISLNYLKSNKCYYLYKNILTPFKFVPCRWKFLLQLYICLTHKYIFSLHSDTLVYRSFKHTHTHKIYSFKLKLDKTGIFHAWIFTFSFKIFTIWLIIFFLSRKDLVTLVFQQTFYSI